MEDFQSTNSHVNADADEKVLNIHIILNLETIWNSTMNKDLRRFNKNWWKFNVRYNIQSETTRSIKNKSISVTPSSKVTLGDIFMLETLFALDLFLFLPWIFGHAEK